MQGRRRVLPSVVMAAGGLFGLLSLSAWFHVQAVRLSYRVQVLHQQLEDLDRREQAERRRLETALSLDRLDERARSHRGLALPLPDQIRLISDR